MKKYRLGLTKKQYEWFMDSAAATCLCMGLVILSLLIAHLLFEKKDIIEGIATFISFCLIAFGGLRLK